MSKYIVHFATVEVEANHTNEAIKLATENIKQDPIFLACENKTAAEEVERHRQELKNA